VILTAQTAPYVAGGAIPGGLFKCQMTVCRRPEGMDAL